MPKKKHPKVRSDADRRVRQCERLARLMQVLHLISGRGRWDAAALAEELECSTRTIHRLLQTLSMAGVPYYYCERTKAYRVRPGFKFPLLEELKASQQSPEPATPQMQAAVNQLIQDGEAFANSLQEFLLVLKKAQKQELQ